MARSKDIILQVDREFGQKYGRSYGLFEQYKMEDAERAIVAIGSTCGTAKVVVDRLRAKGEKVGLLRLRVFRPFPAEEITKALSKCKAIAIMDRADSWSGQGAPLFIEIRSAMFNLAVKPKLINYIYGLGGRDITLSDIGSVYESLKKAEALNEVNYLGVRE
jgi:pyruvate ferredoxin oxidoreductase alpha subunit